MIDRSQLIAALELVEEEAGRAAKCRDDLLAPLIEHIMIDVQEMLRTENSDGLLVMMETAMRAVHMRRNVARTG